MIYLLYIILILIFAYLFSKSAKAEDNMACIFETVGVTIIIVIIIILSNQPTAMHVYQGKTTLEITYKDGVAVDSIVVFKNK